MTRKQALTDLLAKVEAGTLDKGRPFVGEVFIRCDKLGRDYHGAWLEKAYNGSLDAAKALHEAVLPGWVVNGMDQAANFAGDPWGVEVAYFDGPNPNNNRKAYSGHDYSNPARAWLIAIIKALIAEETQ